MIVPPKWNPMHPPKVKIPEKPKEQIPWGERELKSIGLHTFVDKDGEEWDSDDVQWHCPQCKAQYNEAGHPCENCGHKPPNKIVKEFSKKRLGRVADLVRMAGLGCQVEDLFNNPAISSVAGLLRDLVARVSEEGSTNRAAKNLEKDLEKRIRPAFYGNINFGKLLGIMGRKVENQFTDVDIEDFYDYLVDRFIDEGVSVRLLDRLIVTLKKREDLSELDAIKVLSRGTLNEKLDKVLEKYWNKSGDASGPGNEIAKMIFSYIQKTFGFWTLDWIREKEKKEKDRKEVVGPGGGKKKVDDEDSPDDEPEAPVEPAEMPEKEVEEQAKKDFAWEEKLIEDTMDFIDKHAPKGKEVLYKAVLDNLYKEGPKKGLVEMGKEFGISKDTVQRAEVDLKKMLKDFYRSRPDIMRFIGPGFMKDQEVEVPNYQVFMKENSSEQKSLYEWLEGQFKESRVPSEQTMKALKLFSQGKSLTEVTSEIGITPELSRKIKSRYFDEEYKAWFEDRVKNIRKACVLC